MFPFDGSCVVVPYWKMVSTRFDSLPCSEWSWAEMEKVEEWWRYMDHRKIEEKWLGRSGKRDRACVLATEIMEDGVDVLDGKGVGDVSVPEQQQMLEMTERMKILATR